MTQLERMAAGLIYDAGAPEVVAEQNTHLDRIVEFNQLKASQYEERLRLMQEMFAACGEGCYIEPPFYANWGGHHVHFGNYVYANFNLTCVDDGHIYVGDRVMFGPNVTVATASHPIEPSLRARGLQYNKDVHIGANSWIGANVTILPGITIGANVVVGAGSVVTHDLPDNVVAVGNPCRVLREVGEHDREFFYKDERIDWENLTEEPGQTEPESL